MVGGELARKSLPTSRVSSTVVCRPNLARFSAEMEGINEDSKGSVTLTLTLLIPDVLHATQSDERDLPEEQENFFDRKVRRNAAAELCYHSKEFRDEYFISVHGHHWKGGRWLINPPSLFTIHLQISCEKFSNKDLYFSVPCSFSYRITSVIMYSTDRITRMSSQSAKESTTFLKGVAVDLELL